MVVDVESIEVSLSVESMLFNTVVVENFDGVVGNVVGDVVGDVGEFSSIGAIDLILSTMFAPSETGDSGGDASETYGAKCFNSANERVDTPNCFVVALRDIFGSVVANCSFSVV